MDVTSFLCDVARMMGEISVPIWVAVPVGILAFVALFDRLFVPSVRWFLRRRVNRVIDKLNERLELKIQPFKLTRRKVMIDRLTHDPKVMEAIVSFARDEGIPAEVAADKAERYAREIVPSFSALAYFGFGTRISRFISNALYRVRIGMVDDRSLGEVDKDATVIFVMNHRSNMDYVLVTFLAAERSALSYAVGEWARVWPLQQLIRSMGAYFIRRKSRNALYRRVLARYVQHATEGGVTQAIFPEGGLSKDGALQKPKLGLLSYIIADFVPDRSRNVVFIPVGLNYDRVLEDRVLTGSDDGRFTFRFGVFFRFIAHQLWLRISGRFYRFGYACVSFGTPLDLNSFMKTTPENSTERLGQELLDRIANIVPVLPVSLVSHVVLSADAPLTKLQIKSSCHNIWTSLAARQIYSHIPHADEDYAVDVGLRMLTSRHILDEVGGRYEIQPKGEKLLSYYANSISHYFPQPVAFSENHLDQ